VEDIFFLSETTKELKTQENVDRILGKEERRKKFKSNKRGV